MKEYATAALLAGQLVPLAGHASMPEAVVVTAVVPALIHRTMIFHPMVTKEPYFHLIVERIFLFANG